MGGILRLSQENDTQVRPKACVGISQEKGLEERFSRNRPRLVRRPKAKAK